MRIAVSPYHLTTRELPAMVALQLGSSAVTFMPGVMAGVVGDSEPSPSRFERLARSSARYARVVESWGWSMPLWDAGVIESGLPDDDASFDMRAAWERCARDDRYAPLRPFLKGHLLDDPSRWIEAAAADVLKGGPDPAITVPLTAGLDRFAARHRLVVARPRPCSVAQRAEASLARPVCGLVLPMLVQASADRLLLARELLDEYAAPIREALSNAAVGREQSPELRAAAREYEAGFAEIEAELRADQTRDEVRVITAPVSISLAILPSDAALKSSCLAAMSALGGSPVRSEPGIIATDPIDATPLSAFFVGLVGSGGVSQPPRARLGRSRH